MPRFVFPLLYFFFFYRRTAVPAATVVMAMLLQRQDRAPRAKHSRLSLSLSLSLSIPFFSLHLLMWPFSLFSSLASLLLRAQSR